MTKAARSQQTDAARSSCPAAADPTGVAPTGPPARSQTGAADQSLSRTELQRAERIERIERTAARLFATKGYEGTNFADIAAELDMRGPSLYHYFASKDELLLQCLQHSAEQVFVRLRAIVASNQDDPFRALRALIREQVLIEVRDFPEFVPIFFKLAIPSHDVAERVLQVRREHAAIFEQTAEAVRSIDGTARTHMRVWLGVTFGALAYLADWYDPTGELAVEQLADLMAETLTGHLRSGRP